MELARRACDLTGRREPLFIGTLAAAYAEAGRFEEAAAAAQAASEVARGQTNEAVAARNMQLLECTGRIGRIMRSEGRMRSTFGGRVVILTGV